MMNKVFSIAFLTLLFLLPLIISSQDSVTPFYEGETTGTIGDQSVDIFGWGDGDITGTIGDDEVNLYDWGDGTITGTIGASGTSASDVNTRIGKITNAGAFSGSLAAAQFPLAAVITSAATTAGKLAARTAMGAGTSSFSGSAGDLTGDIDPDRFDAGDFPMFNIITADNAAAVNTITGSVTADDMEWGSISITVGTADLGWAFVGSGIYVPSGTTVSVTMAVTHPTYGTSSIVCTWTRNGNLVSDFGLSGSPEGTGSGATGSGNNAWTFGDVNSDSGSADNAFGSDSTAHGTKTIYVQHSNSNKIMAITTKVTNANFGGGKCLTPAMLPEGLEVGDEVDSPVGKTKVVKIVEKQREGYYILEDELEITNDHPILIEGEWILAEEYQGKKEYIDESTEVIYVETENELLTVKGWTVGGKY